MNPIDPSDEELNALIDGELDPTRAAHLAALARGDTHLAARIEHLRAGQQRLRAALASLPAREADPRFDPALIRRRLAHRRQTRLATVAALLLAVCLGGVGGWQGREMAALSVNPPMADAVQAYRLFASSATPALDVAFADLGQLQQWLDTRFDHAAPIPDLNRFGFQPVGARLMATEQGAAAMVWYRDARGESVMFYIRPPGRSGIDRGNRRDGDLVAQYWAARNYHYALVSPGDSPRSAAVRQAVDPLI